MGNSNLIKNQLGVESVFGTPVTATRQLVGNLTMDFEPERVLREEARASMGGPNVHDDMSYISNGRYEGRATVGELPYFWSASVRGDPTISTPSGGTDSRQHLYTQPLSSVPALKSLTVYDGDNTQATRTGGVTVSQWVLSGNDTEAWRFSAQLMGQRQATSTFAAIAALTGNALADTETAKNKLSKVYADNAGSGIGGTQLTATLYGFTLTWNSAIAPDHTMDNTLDMGDIHRNTPTVTLELLLKWNAIGVAEWSSFRSNTRRFIRIENIGSTIEDAITRLIRIDGAYDITRFVKRESVQDGTVRGRLTATAVEDPTWGKKLELAVINTLTAL